MEPTVNKRQRTACLAVVLFACFVLVARPVNSRNSTEIITAGNSFVTDATLTTAIGESNVTGSEMDATVSAEATRALPSNGTAVSTNNSTNPATRVPDRVAGGLTETQITIVIAVCAGVGGLLLLIALVASLAYFKVRHNKRRRIRVTTTGPQAQATTGNANEMGDRQILDA